MISYQFYTFFITFDAKLRGDSSLTYFLVHKRVLISREGASLSLCLLLSVTLLDLSTAKLLRGLLLHTEETGLVEVEQHVRATVLHNVSH